MKNDFMFGDNNRVMSGDMEKGNELRRLVDDLEDEITHREENLDAGKEKNFLFRL